jgi:hypothetical protein
LAGGKAVGAVGTTLGIGSLAKAYESKPVRNLLMRVNSAQKGKEQELIKNLPKMLQAVRQRMGED